MSAIERIHRTEAPNHEVGFIQNNRKGANRLFCLLFIQNFSSCYDDDENYLPRHRSKIDCVSLLLYLLYHNIHTQTTLSGETFSGEIVVTKRKICHFRPIKVKVSLDDVQMKLRGKKVI